MMQKNISRILLLLVMLLGNTWVSINAQGSRDLLLNEVLLYNDSNYVDDYGNHNTWIEIFNSGYSTVDVGGLYLTNDINQPTKCKIPRGNVVTSIAPLNYFVVWADGNSDKGIIHLNFTLKEGDILALFDANGKTLLDSVKIIEGQLSNQSYGRGENDRWEMLSKTSPMFSNKEEGGMSSSEEFGKVDPTGTGMMAIAMSVVFSALILLFVVLKFMARLLSKDKKKSAKKEKVSVEEAEEGEISGEVNAAIAMSLYLYKEQMHDYEDTVLTINKVSRTYSPWSSKIYGLRKYPR